MQLCTCNKPIRGNSSVYYTCPVCMKKYTWSYRQRKYIEKEENANKKESDMDR